RGGVWARLFRRSWSTKAAILSLAAVVVLGVAITLTNGLPVHQKVNRAAKADALVTSAALKLLALKAPGRDLAELDEPAETGPVSDTDVFDAHLSCLPPAEAIERLQVERDAMGGKVVVLAEGLQQSFSDAWRLNAHVAPVRVSSVVAHIFPVSDEGDWYGDVVEFDAKGCAMTRTLVPGGTWNSLLEAAFAGQA